MSDPKVVCYWSTLIGLARAEGQARLGGGPQALAQAEAEHQAYKRACLAADELVLGQAVGELAP